MYLLFYIFFFFIKQVLYLVKPVLLYFLFPNYYIFIFLFFSVLQLLYYSISLIFLFVKTPISLFLYVFIVLFHYYSSSVYICCLYHYIYRYFCNAFEFPSTKNDQICLVFPKNKYEIGKLFLMPIFEFARCIVSARNYSHFSCNSVQTYDLQLRANEPMTCFDNIR